MKHKIEIILASLWIAVALFFTILLCAGVSGKFHWSDLVRNKHIDANSRATIRDYDLLDKTETQTSVFGKNQFNNIECDLITETINIETHNKNEIQVSIVTNIPEAYRPHINIEENTLKIAQEFNLRPRIRRSERCEVFILVPESMQFDDLDIETISGDIKLDSICADKIKTKCTSGDIYITKCDAHEMTVKSTSGDTTIESTDTDSLKSKSTSGDFSFTGNCPKANLESTSSSIHFTTAKPLIGDSDFETTSGSIKITVPQNSDFALDYRTVSGKIYDTRTNSTFKGKGHFSNKNSSSSIKIDTVSGDAEILSLN